MAKSVNKVILVGNVGKDPDIKFAGNGNAIASFSLATTDRTKDQGGNWTDRTEWHNLVAFQRTAEVIRDYVKKGSKIYVEGRIQTRSWEDKETKEKRYRTEIVVNDLVLLSGRGEGESGASPRSSSQYDQRPPAHGDDLVQSTEITDDDIPF